MAHAFHFLLGLCISLSFHFIPSQASSNVYIVYLGHNQNKHPFLTTDNHLQFLSNVFESKDGARQAMLYSYKHGFSGFSATLNSKQAKTLAETDGVISVFKSKTLDLHTTRSWDFLGLSRDYSDRPLQEAYGGDITVGILDSGIWPESLSFREEPGMGPVPRSWKGKCVCGEMFDPARACNRKLIGAKYFVDGFEQRYRKLNETGYKEYRSPYDAVGHGTHTASIAVGSVVRNANFLGFGQGTARGGAPRARLAVYKTCWNLNNVGKCNEADILAAFDEALHDGVNVISGSFGLTPPLRLLFRSSADIGSFHAMQKGVSVVFSAGNDGPAPSLVANVAPWGISVAASTIDRTFATQISVDGGKLSILGEGFVGNKIKGPLVNASYSFRGGVCREDLMNTSKTVKGKVMLCFGSLGTTIYEAESTLRKTGAAGLIFVESSSCRPNPSVTLLPYVHIDTIQGNKLSNYMDLAQPSRPPTVEIYPSKTVLQRSPAPIVADFSSRGPSSLSPDILKPDLTAPGVNILAAWPRTTPPAGPGDNRAVAWNFQTGTSMSCPHVAGVVALLKSAHPDWSPAVVRSALMTTAYNTDTTGDQILDAGTAKSSDPFDVGAGHINPLRAMDPGLVYDMKTTDYVIFLCNIGYTWDQIRLLVQIDTDNTICTTKADSGHGTPWLVSNANLNYPSITVTNLRRSTTIMRTVRRVGLGNMVSVYFVKVVNPNGVEVAVWPRLLIFSPFKQEATYYVTFTPIKMSQGRYDFGEIVWSDGSHYVRSPVVVSVNTIGDTDGGGETATT